MMNSIYTTYTDNNNNNSNNNNNININNNNDCISTNTMNITNSNLFGPERTTGLTSTAGYTSSLLDQHGLSGISTKNPLIPSSLDHHNSHLSYSTQLLLGSSSTQPASSTLAASNLLLNNSNNRSFTGATTSNYLSSSLGGNLGTDMTKLLSTTTTTTTPATSSSSALTSTITTLTKPTTTLTGTTDLTNSIHNNSNLLTSTTTHNNSTSYANLHLNDQPKTISVTSTAGLTGAIGAGGTTILRQLMDDMRQIEDTVDSIEIPARGRCKVFMAKYGYDPFKQSPNENPDAELAFNAGDYIMVFDDLDEDGYFIGELMDGRRGYVPSNWLERLTGDDLFDFQANVLYKQPLGHTANSTSKQVASSSTVSNNSVIGHSINQQQQQQEYNVGDDLTAASHHANSSAADFQCYPPDYFDPTLQDSMSNTIIQHLLLDPADYHRMNDYVDLDDVNEVDDECLSDYERAEAEQMRRAVPPPQRLILEKTLNKCILIAWLHPQTAKGTIVSYQVYVDGVLKSTVPSGDRTKALLEGVDTSIPHRISVRAIDVHGHHSNDAGCTIVIGTRVPFAPSCVKASHITSDSALISWLPCNSNFYHVVAVNRVEVQTVRPGVYKHLINGLSANTLFRVSVQAKPGKILSVDERNPKKLESLITYVDFKTMPKSLPDPPVNVQVEAGPQRRTLLVTWLPLTLNDYGGSSNGCPVTGYAVFAGHKKLADIDSPTGDHALLDLNDLESLHKKSVTVRTKSGENLSQDSMPCQIPDEYLKTTTATIASSNAPNTIGGFAAQYGAKHHTDPHHHTSHQRQQHHGHQQIASSSSRGHSHQQHHGMVAGGYPSNAHRLSTESTAGSQSPAALNGGVPGARQRSMGFSQHQRALSSARYRGGAAAGRPMVTRSLQNLDSDLDSRRSSLLVAPSIEVSRDHHHHHHTTMAGDLIPGSSAQGGGGGGSGLHTESYSEEEFESSMRLRSSTGANLKGGSGSKGSTRSYRASGSQSQQHSPARYNINSASNRQSMTYARQRAAQAATAAAAASAGANAGTINSGDSRYFVALFDYDPLTMSPNPNAASDELSFKEGTIIKVYGPLGEDGFYKGELESGQMGFVPCNVITEITDPNLLQSLYASEQNPNQQQQQQQNLQQTATNKQQMMLNISAAAAGPGAQNQQQPGTFSNQTSIELNASTMQQQQQQQQGGGVKRMVALYDYDPQENSPNADTESEIPFKTGDIIYVYGKMDTDGFYMGEVERTKQRGLVPSNFLREDPSGNTAVGARMVNAAGVMQQQSAVNSTGFANQLPQNQQQQMQMQMQQSMQNMPTGFNTGGPLNQANSQQQQQQQQQQQMQMRNTNQMRPNSMMPPQPQQQQNINRPTTLSLGAQQQMQMMPGQMQQGNTTNASNMLMQQQQQPNRMIGPNNVMTSGMNNPQQQQQQQGGIGGGGVLSNLLSSGKQIIGAATTPRPPNTQQQQQQHQQNFMPNMSNTQNNQQQQQQQFNNMMGGGVGVGGINQMQHQQQQAPMLQQQDNNFNRLNNQIAPRPQQQQQMSMQTNFNQQQQQPLQTNTMDQQQLHMGNSYVPQMQQPQAQQQQQQPPMFASQGFGNNAGIRQPPPMMMGNPNQQQQQQHNQQQQQHHFGPGDDQGGNILNTVKNMFKL